MNLKELTYLLENPDQVKKGQVQDLEKLSREFSYFQPIRALKLKGLKDQESFRYNQELKTTAAYTVDREVLFDFITSKLFSAKSEKESIEKKKKTDIEVIEPTEVKTLPRMSMDDAVKMKMEEAEDVLDPSLFATKQEESVFRHVTISEALAKKTEDTEESATQHVKNTTTESELEIDKPLDFDKKETHSFTEWLKLTSLTPIKRDTEEGKHKSVEQEENDNSEKNDSATDQKQKFDLIDQFIANNPKIKPAEKTSANVNLAKENMTAPEELMTETLARVYLAQKNYKKAIQAYKILILKNPEKSGFFADQIRAIKNLKENK